jgi:hypothetical protein
MVESRLRRRITELGLASVDDYFRYLFENGALTQELDTIFDAVTTNKTDFFREADHFIHLTERLIPARLSRRKANGRPRCSRSGVRPPRLGPKPIPPQWCLPTAKAAGVPSSGAFWERTSTTRS